MAKHNYYPETLKIQIIERLLAGESGSSLREEFNIPGRGIIYKWKQWYLKGEIHRLKASSGRPLEQEASIYQTLQDREKELELLKKFFSKERW
ncbi:helix-turn-helix domain-containing protein [Enterococcus hermanniensis]|uniref:helix-turn-helix domain-containing protein n=1 Tax=Enterococcus hermanniensis TaxID=249189 RepID=UPI00361F536E